MSDQRRPGGDQDDPLRRVVAEHWDEIAQFASHAQRERLLGLLDGTAEPDPAEARAALADELLDILPPSHPVIGLLRTGIAFRPPGLGAVLVPPGGAEGAGDGPAGEPIIASRSGARTLPVTIYVADEHIHAGVEAAVVAMIEAAGLEIASREEPVRGSWFRRMTARAQGGMRDVGEAESAEMAARMLGSLPSVLKELQPTKEAVIWVGTLLIVKADDAVSVSQLSPAQQQQLEQSPYLAMSPGEIKAALRLSPAETPRFQAEPALTFGQPRIALVADDELPPEVWRRADLLELRLTGVAVPFSLEEPPEECWCTEAVVSMTVDSPGVLGAWLTVPRTAFGAGYPMDDALVDDWGTGTQCLNWKLVARSELIGLRPRGREILAVLESSQQAAQLTGTLAARVRFTGREAESARMGAAQPLPFTLSLA